MSEQYPIPNETRQEVVDTLHDRAVQQTIEEENLKIAEREQQAFQAAQKVHEARAVRLLVLGNERSKTDYDAVKEHLGKLDRWQATKDRGRGRHTRVTGENSSLTTISAEGAYLSSLSAAAQDRYKATLKRQETLDDKYGKLGLGKLAHLQAQAELDNDRTTAEDIQPYLENRVVEFVHGANSARSARPNILKNKDGSDIYPLEIAEGIVSRLKENYKQDRAQAAEAQSPIDPDSTPRGNGEDSADAQEDLYQNLQANESGENPVVGAHIDEAVRTLAEPSDKTAQDPEHVEPTSETVAEDAAPVEKERLSKRDRLKWHNVKAAFKEWGYDKDFDPTYGASMEALRIAGIGQDVIDQVMVRRTSESEDVIVPLRLTNASTRTEQDAPLDELFATLEDEEAKQRRIRLRRLGRKVIGLTARDRDIALEQQRLLYEQSLNQENRGDKAA